jgi:hypothetical protein
MIQITHLAIILRLFFFAHHVVRDSEIPGSSFHIIKNPHTRSEMLLPHACIGSIVFPCISFSNIFWQRRRSLVLVDD